MLPVRLALHNFLPYRAPDPISFRGGHLAGGRGPTGAGKASLLDAITWARWGRARARSDQELIALGADEMSVELDFEQEGALYRVVRQRERKRRQGSLRLFLWDEAATGNFRDLSAASLRETQQKITDLLRLDYETFVHSAFLQQGQADAFTVKGPAERKKILGDILGLDAWRGYEERARLELTRLEDALLNIDGRLREIEDALLTRPQLERDLAAAEAAYAEAEAILQQAEARYAEIADAPARLRAATDRLADLARRLREYESDERALLGEVERQQGRVAAYEAVIAQREAIESGYATLSAARETDQALSERLLALQEAETRRHALEGQIAAARAALENQAAAQRSTLAEIERLTADAEAIESELAAVEADVHALADRETERDRLHKTIAALNEEAATLRAANSGLLAEMNAIKARMDTLSAADPASALCPTCRQPLAPAQRARLLDDYRDEGTARGDQYRANATRLDELRQTVKARQADLDGLLAEVSRLNILRHREGELRARQAAVREADTRRAEAQAALDSLDSALAGEAYAAEARAQLTSLTAEIAALDYNRTAHAAAREDLSAFRAYETRQQELQLALAALPEARQALAGAQERLARLHRVRAEDGQAQTDLTAEVEQLKALVQEANRRFDEARERRSQLNHTAEKRARAQQALAALDSARSRRDSLERRRADLLARQEVYTQLRDAFGKNGIPAMIIEAALPELEDEANAVLARLAAGRMQVRFATHRETVKGETSETLDIVIADELGVRDYALYSGGEAFRVDFAIRIALSKLLARRAGAHLRTLFIDEGFGTQDAEGRDRLVEAINAVAGDFDLILVITHIDDLRDAFPVRLEVEKTPSGSRVRVG
jgi:exonuclease SbcC